ncbi:MAG: DUF3047 domain-containing protein [Rhodospirillaceae bacterium]|nr:DUF3047 domain-containing protein [Rhodospirillaceae bacterium]MBT5563536.1 DUF3047 domain-containing protein [Rhodospirillaceae bacterium]MBT7137739.1 DUF3047 domain-containing protein [Rhodospirillaceae bacterium]
MQFIPLFLTVLILPTLAFADVTGPARVVDGDLIVGDFEAGNLTGWQEKAFKNKTLYELVEGEVGTVLKADSKASASGLYREIKIDLVKTPCLTWSWKVDGILNGLDETTKNGDDYPARVYVVFSGGLFFWKTRALNYVWSNGRPIGSVWPNAYTSKSIIIDGDRECWVLDRGKAQRNADGRAYRLTGSMGDVTERKKTEQSLLNNQKVLRVFLDSTIDNAALINLDGIIQNINKAMAERYGKAQDDLIGQPMFASPPTETGKRRWEWVNEVIETRTFVRRIDEQEGIWFDNSYFPVFDDNGMVIQIAIFARDITDQKELEKALKESQTRFRDFAESASDYFWETDIQHRLVWESERVNEIAGLKFEDVKGKARWELPGPVKDDKDFWKEFRATVEDHQPFRDFEFPYENKDGKIFEIRVSGVPVFEDKTFIGYRGVTRDVTDLKKAEFELKIAKERAESADRAKSDLLANMSHELRTPLNAILGFSAMMKEEVFGVLDEKYVEYANDINRSGGHLLELINDILDVSAIDAGKIELDEENLDVGEVIEVAVNMVSARAETGNVRLVSIPSNDLPELYADARRLTQILLNLLSNAIKFTPANGEVSIAACVDDEDAHIITIIDTGVGMSGEELDKAMSKFGQVDSGLNRRHEGTGLGLPLARRLIELHGGQMQIDSKKGGGTTVTIKFPAQRTVT